MPLSSTDKTRLQADVGVLVSAIANLKQGRKLTAAEKNALTNGVNLLKTHVDALVSDVAAPSPPPPPPPSTTVAMWSVI